MTKLEISSSFATAVFYSKCHYFESTTQKCLLLSNCCIADIRVYKTTRQLECAGGEA